MFDFIFLTEKQNRKSEIINWKKKNFKFRKKKEPKGSIKYQSNWKYEIKARILIDRSEE
jgi:hypothetical protein